MLFPQQSTDKRFSSQFDKWWNTFDFQFQSMLKVVSENWILIPGFACESTYLKSSSITSRGFIQSSRSSTKLKYVQYKCKHAIIFKNKKKDSILLRVCYTHLTIYPFRILEWVVAFCLTLGDSVSSCKSINPTYPLVQFIVTPGVNHGQLCLNEATYNNP